MVDGAESLVDVSLGRLFVGTARKLERLLPRAHALEHHFILRFDPDPQRVARVILIHVLVVCDGPLTFASLSKLAEALSAFHPPFFGFI